MSDDDHSDMDWNVDIPSSQNSGDNHSDLGWTNPKQFLVKVQQALNSVRQKSLETTLEKAIKDKEECSQKLLEANEALANCMGNDENLLQKANEAVTHKQETCKYLIT